MDLEATRKTLAKPSAFSTKKIAFIGIAGLVLVVGIALRASHYLGETSAESEPAAVIAPPPEAAAPSPAATTESVVKTPPVAPVTQEAAPTPSAPAATQESTATPSTPAATPEAAPAPSEPAQEARETPEQPVPAGDATGQAEQAEVPGAGMILVSRKPVEVRAGPSASAPAMFGFPAGRPFRVIGREGSFVQIQDLRSSARGWIDAAVLAAPPATKPSVAAPSQSKPGAVRKPATAAADPKPRASKKGAPAVAGPEPAAPDQAQARRPPSLFGRGGFFGGIFRN